MIWCGLRNPNAVTMNQSIQRNQIGTDKIYPLENF